MLNTSSVVHKEFYSLEKHFEAVCSLHPHLKLLESQWRFDQELISKALQNIGSIFPHYSRHDASHSRQIIVNIERILGDKIQYLTATDTWLILEAAYNHDIGMVITQKQIEDMNTEEFHNFVVDLKNDTDHYLQEFAQNWLEKKATLPQQAPAHDFFQQYLQLLAEWYRRKHPHNSARIIRSPIEEIGLNSPRNELLPKRLFSILADICESHGRSFEELINQLPQAEAGMASEDCHPRYVACLLRMGDLLDVDDNRFCPVMIAMCGHNMPHLSKTHYEKHQSIRHLRMDSERIEVKCVCPTPDAYEEAYNWFDWLQQEYHKQTQHWHKIVPYPELGRLPTLMTPIVEMEEPYIILDEGKKPTVKVNKNAFLDLVRGTGLYGSKFYAIREILQNAVDSTLHRIWIEHKDEFKDQIKSPKSPRLEALYNKYSINITFEPHEKENLVWVLRIKDQGTGISHEDLKYILEVGSSSKNKQKTKRVLEMPIWFRPSGAFGIGLQSAFLLADQFTLITSSMIDQQSLKITFSKEKNNVIIEKLKNKDPNSKYGTEFIIEIKLENIPNTLSHPIRGINLLNEIYSNFDITKPDLSKVQVIKIEEQIFNFFKYSNIQSNKTKRCGISEDLYFDEEENVIIRDIKFCESDRYNSFSFSFRGQNFNDLNPNILCVKCKMDFYHTTSDKFLTYNREKIKPEYRNEVSKKVMRIVEKYIENKFDDLTSDEQIYAAFSYIASLSSLEYDDIASKYKDKVSLFPVYMDGKKITLKSLIEQIKSGNIQEISVNKNHHFQERETKLSNPINNILKDEIVDYIKYMVTKSGMYYSQVSHGFDAYSIQFLTEEIQPVTNEEFKSIIMKKDGSNLASIGCRKVFPAWKEYRKLAINIKGIYWLDIHTHHSYQADYLVLPLNFNYEKHNSNFYDKSDDFNNWIYSNRKNLNITFEEIQELNESLISHIKEIINN